MISAVTQNIQKQYSKRSFRSKILLLLVTFVAVQVLLIAFFCNEALKMTVHDQVSSPALMQASAIASDPNIINDMEKFSSMRTRAITAFSPNNKTANNPLRRVLKSDWAISVNRRPIFLAIAVHTFGNSNDIT